MSLPVNTFLEFIPVSNMQNETEEDKEFFEVLTSIELGGINKVANLKVNFIIDAKMLKVCMFRVILASVRIMFQLFPILYFLLLRIIILPCSVILLKNLYPKDLFLSPQHF